MGLGAIVEVDDSVGEGFGGKELEPDGTMAGLNRRGAFADEDGDDVDAELVDFALVQKGGDDFAAAHHPDIFAGLGAQALGKDIWMMGGGEIIASFLDQGEIDEFRIHVIPILIGEGTPPIQPRHRSIWLKLLAAKAFPDGLVLLHYRTKPHSCGSAAFEFSGTKKRCRRVRS